MTYLRSAIATIVLLLLVLTAYTYFSFDEKYTMDQALESYLKGDYSKASNLLSKVDREDLIPQKLLYEGYVERERGNFQASDKLFEEAADETRNDTRAKLRLEIYLNQALNGYLENNGAKMESALLSAKEFLGNKSNNWVDFYQNLYINSFLPDVAKSMREEEINYWDRIEERIPFSLWMKRAIAKQFTPVWQFSGHINYLINSGKYVQARQMIEEEMPKSDEAEKEDLYLLMARSYAAEAKSKPPLAATPYYKLAFSYYNKIPFQQERFKAERTAFFKDSKEQMGYLIKEEKFDELDFFVNVIDRFDSEVERQELSETFIQLVDVQRGEKKWENVVRLLRVLNKVLPEDDIARDNLNARLKNELQEAIEIGDVNRVSKSWEQLFTLNPNNSELRDKYGAEVADKAIFLSTSEKGFRPQGIEMIKFWNGIERDREKREAFSARLVEESSKLWNNREDNVDATRLLIAAVRIVNDQNRKKVEDLIRKQLQRSYSEQYSVENFESLEGILQAKQALGLSDLTIVSSDDIKNYIAKAQKLFAKREFQKANSLTNWILTLQPNQKRALTIAGLVNYYEGNYKSAENYLSKIPTESSEIQTALAVSEVLSGVDSVKGKKSIEELVEKKLVDSAIFLRLGLGEVVNEKPEEALYWLSKLNSDNDEVEIGLALAYAEMGKWRDVIGHLSKLSEPYQQLDAVRSLLLLAEINTDDKEGAKKALDRLMYGKSDAVVSKADYSQPFSILSKRVLNDYSKYFTAALYYEEQGNIEEALRYLERIEKPSATTLMKMGELLIAAKREQLAKEKLIEALILAKSDLEAESLQAEILESLARISNSQNEKIDAYIFYRDYFNLKPNDERFRFDYAKALIDVRKFDKSKEQFEKLKESGKYREDYNLFLIEVLIHLDNFYEADTMAARWVKSSKNLGGERLLKLAQLMLITGNQELINRIVERLPPVNEMKTNELNELIKFYLYQGNLQKAHAVLEQNRELLEKSGEGLFGIAQFYSFYSDNETAVKYAEKALEKDPYNIDIQQFLQTNQTGLTLKDLIDKLGDEGKGKGQKSYNYDGKLMLIQSIIDRATEKIINSNEESFHTIAELRTALIKLINLSEQLKDVPKVQLDMGQLYFLLENVEDAKKFINIAIELDFSYSRAREYFGMLYLSQKELNEAKDQLLEAIKFKPYSSEAWFLLGRMNEEKGAYYDAIMAYDHSIKYKPNNTRPYLLMAKLQLEVNNPESALTTLKDLLLIDPDDVEGLKLKLLALYNPHLSFEEGQASDLIAQRIKVESKLQDLAPEKLEEVMNAVQSKEAFRPIKKMSFPY